MVLKQHPILDQKYGIFAQINAKCQPPQRNFRLTLRSWSQKTVHADYVGLSCINWDWEVTKLHVLLQILCSMKNSELKLLLSFVLN